MSGSLFDARSQVVRDLASAFTEGSDSDAWSQGDVYRDVLAPLGEEVLRLEHYLAWVGLYLDVMIGNGPGAVDAYFRHDGAVAKGPPTRFGQMQDHARAARKLVQAALAPESEPVDV